MYFHIVYFVPDPFLEGKVPIGALVQDPAGVLHAVQAQVQPTADCLGGIKRKIACEHILAHLGEVRAFADLVPTFGACVSLGRELRVPRAAAGDVMNWLVQHILPSLHRAET